MGQRRVRERNRVAWLAVALGAWLLVAPFVRGYPRVHPFLRTELDDLFVGALAVTFGWVAARRGDRARSPLRGLIVLGLWLLLSVPVLGLRTGNQPHAKVDALATGIALVLVAVVALLRSSDAPPPPEPVGQPGHPVLWAGADGPYRGQASDAKEQQARHSIRWAWLAVAVVLAATIAFAVGFVLHLVPLLVAAVVVGALAALAAWRVGILSDTTVGQEPSGA